MLPWQPADLTHLSTNQPEPNEDYMKRVCNEIPPDGTDPETMDTCVKSNGPLKVYTTDEQVKAGLKHPGFVFVDDFETADILWINDAWKDFP